MNYDPCWLPARDVPDALRTPADAAGWELTEAGIRHRLCVRPDWGEAYELTEEVDGYCVTGGETGVLYGAYRLLLSLRAGEPWPQGQQTPAYPIRMLDHWDNMDGSVERGYAGRSLFFEGGDFLNDWPRLRAYARLLASVGVNGICLNNVNVAPPATELIGERFLPKVSRLAAMFFTFGIRLMLSVDFAAPCYDGLPTADPLDARVQAWWRERVLAVYREVPALLGFLVKADSEHRPGPYTYGRDHAQGANLLADALQPFGGWLIWRCFVYNCKQDWRDTQTDRPKAAYENYAHLDGAFHENVLLQIKYGPFDFQVREPMSPLLLSMPRTRKALELQLAQEYTGQQIDLYAMPGMWRELFEDLPQGSLRAVAAVANTGRDACWTGHPFAQLNLFAYGIMAWQPSAEPEALIARWAKLTYGVGGTSLRTLVSLLLHSRETYERYTAPLGLCWMVNPNGHYGPSPMGYEYSPWGTYHRANRVAVGVDRTAKGTGFLLQYPPEWQQRYADPTTCPEELLLFFHRLPYGYIMRDGRTLIQRIYDDRYAGAAEAEQMAEALRALAPDLPESVYREATERMGRQVRNAREWRDVLCDFFYRYSGIADEKGRL